MGFSRARLQLVKSIPAGKGWFYEPKFDGYRGILAKSVSGRARRGVELVSLNAHEGARARRR